MGWFGLPGGDCSCCRVCETQALTPSEYVGTWKTQTDPFGSEPWKPHSYYCTDSTGELRLTPTVGNEGERLSFGFRLESTNDAGSDSAYPANGTYYILFDGLDFEDDAHRMKFVVSGSTATVTLQDIAAGTVTDLFTVPDILIYNTNIYIVELGPHLGLHVNGNTVIFTPNADYVKKGGNHASITVDAQSAGSGFQYSVFRPAFSQAVWVGFGYQYTYYYQAGNICIDTTFGTCGIGTEESGMSFISRYSVPTNVGVELSYSDFELNSYPDNTPHKQCHDGEQAGAADFDEDWYVGPRTDDVSWTADSNWWGNPGGLSATGVSLFPEEFQGLGDCPGDRTACLWSTSENCSAEYSTGGGTANGCGRGISYHVAITDARPTQCPAVWPFSVRAGDDNYLDVWPDKLVRVWLLYRAYGSTKMSEYPDCSGASGTVYTAQFYAMFMSEPLLLAELASGNTHSLSKTGEYQTPYGTGPFGRGGAWDWADNISLWENAAPFSFTCGDSATVSFL